MCTTLSWLSNHSTPYIIHNTISVLFMAHVKLELTMSAAGGGLCITMPCLHDFFTAIYVFSETE